MLRAHWKRQSQHECWSSHEPGDGGALLSSLLSSTQTAVKSGHGRKSKIRARHDTRIEETNTRHVAATRESRVREQEVSHQKAPQTLRADQCALRAPNSAGPFLGMLARPKKHLNFVFKG